MPRRPWRRRRGASSARPARPPAPAATAATSRCAPRTPGMRGDPLPPRSNPGETVGEVEINIIPYWLNITYQYVVVVKNEMSPKVFNDKIYSLLSKDYTTI